MHLIYAYDYLFTWNLKEDSQLFLFLLLSSCYILLFQYSDI